MPLGLASIIPLADGLASIIPLAEGLASIMPLADGLASIIPLAEGLGAAPGDVQAANARLARRATQATRAC
jgi:hypothetical protein